MGEATLSIYPTFFGSLQPFVNDLITRKVVPIDGSAYFEFDIEQELHLKQDYERQYLLDALVEERSTGSVQNYSTVLTLYLNHFRVEPVKLPSYYLPGVPFEATVSTKIYLNRILYLFQFTYRPAFSVTMAAHCGTSILRSPPI